MVEIVELLGRDIFRSEIHIRSTVCHVVDDLHTREWDHEVSGSHCTSLIDQCNCSLLAEWNHLPRFQGFSIEQAMLPQSNVLYSKISRK